MTIFPDLPEFLDVDPVLTAAFYILRIVFIVVDIGLILATFHAIYQFWINYRPSFETRPVRPRSSPTLQTAVFQERWQTILKKFRVGTPEAVRLAIIEADALVDETLKKMGISGETMAERLTRFNPEEVTTLDRLWRAHRLRNEVVHTPGYAVAPEEAEKAMRNYQAFLEEIQILK